MFENTKSIVLFGVAIILTMLVVFYSVGFYSLVWEIILYVVSYFGAIYTKTMIIPALKAFGVVFVFCVGIAGGMITINALTTKNKKHD